MEAREILYIMRQIAPSATLEDAEAFLATCRERGLTPFSEVSPIITDYTRKDGTRVHSMSVKEHYSVMERWARQCGGYSIRQRRVWRDEAGVHAEIGLVSNRDYAAVGQLCARVPGLDFHAELAGFMAVEEAIVTADEMGKKQPPKGKSWEWLAEKRAREAALLRLFGREPSQARQLYQAAIGALTAQQANALLYDAPAPALPAPAPASTPTDVGVGAVTVETEIEAETEGEPAPSPAPAPVVEGDVTEVAPAEPAPATPTPTPAQNGAREWPFPVLQAILQARLSDGTTSAKKALALSNLSADVVTPDQAVAWMRAYRAARDEGSNPQDAANRANGA